MSLPDISRIPPRTVGPEEIRLVPGPYCMSFGFDLGGLMAAIRSAGLVNPPVLLESGDDDLLIPVTGYRRLLACRDMGWKEIPCRIVRTPGPPPPEYLLLNLHDNLATRRLNPLEKAMALVRLSAYLPGAEIIEKFLPLLGLPPRQGVLRLYRAVLEELDPETQEWVAAGRIPVPVAGRILEMSPDERPVIFNAIKNLNLNINYQKQFIDYIMDLKSIESRSIPELLAHPRLEEISGNPRLNPPQKARAVLRALRERRFPRLSLAERDFRKTILRLGLPRGVRIEAPPFFESPDYRLEVVFREGGDLKETLRRLLQIPGLENLGDPWRSGGG
ncbi:MAG: hypothetical protein DRH56_05750 [Deltaproteobacteria bacterium]|nr:MAG: hypothetical protein DRH56_05750 [Deltaproteobacteria bacterium]